MSVVLLFKRSSHEIIINYEKTGHLAAPLKNKKGAALQFNMSTHRPPSPAAAARAAA